MYSTPTDSNLSFVVLDIPAPRFFSILPSITASPIVVITPTPCIGINVFHNSLASIPSTTAVLAVGPPQGNKFITPIAAPTINNSTCGLIFNFLYKGNIAGIVTNTVVAVAPSKWPIIPIIAVTTVIATTLFPAFATNLSINTSNIPASFITPK